MMQNTSLHSFISGAFKIHYVEISRVSENQQLLIYQSNVYNVDVHRIVTQYYEIVSLDNVFLVVYNVYSKK